MAQQLYKISLDSVPFPMLSEQQTRTIIGTATGDAGGAEGKPSIAYCHNVMPTRLGFDSVGFLSVVPALETLPVGLTLSDVRVAFGDERSRLYLAWDTEGNVYSLTAPFASWVAIAATVPATGGPSFTTESVTTGIVNGVSYIFYSTIGAFTYNETTNVLDAVTLTGLTISTVLGVVASSGYLVAYTKESIAWSSTLDPTDFIPSQVTGSGGGNVAGIAGSILFITSNSLGLLVYTSANILAGTYTGNVQFPFKFRPIDDGKGGISLDRVAYEVDSERQFVYSKAGLQTVNSRKAEIVVPEVTDFLAGRRIEDYNEVTKEYEITDIGAPATLLKKIKFIASRYLIISYGISSFTHALVYDLALKKLGKLKIDHTDCFEFIGNQTEVSKESVAFLLPTGEVKILNFSVTNASNGVLILGKVQFVRSRLLTLLGVEVENVEEGATLSVSSRSALDGKNTVNVEGTIRVSEDKFREYVFLTSAKNHSIVFAGYFNIVTAQIRYKIDGKE